MYGLTDGGINAEEFSLTPLGNKATEGDEVERVAALKAAVLKVDPYAKFFRTFNGKKVPASAPLKEFLLREGQVDESRVEECIAHIIEDARTAGMLRSLKGGEWVQLEGVPSDMGRDAGTGDDSDGAFDDGSSDPADTDAAPEFEAPVHPEHLSQATTTRASAVLTGGPKKVFIAHGENRTPLDQLKKALDQFKVKYAVAVDEPNRGRPISRKVAELMEGSVHRASSSSLLMSAS
jgi:hypothetical protein